MKLVCNLCKREVDKLTKDHIVPVSYIRKLDKAKIKYSHILTKKNKKIFGHYIPNIRMICGDCNSKRGNKLFNHPLINEISYLLENKKTPSYSVERCSPPCGED